MSCWRKISALVMAAAILLVITGPALAQRRDTVVIGIAQEPDNLVSIFSHMSAAVAVERPLLLSMIERDNRGTLFPRLVEKIPTVKDGDWVVQPDKRMRVTYRFKRGYTWHDGRPVTALDASWTYLMMRNPRSPTVSRVNLRSVDSMHAPDPAKPYTLVVQWSEPFPFANLGHQIYPRHFLEREYLKDPAGLRNHANARAPIGNGPYRFVEWVPGSHIAFQAYDKFVEGAARIRRLVFRFVLDSRVLQASVIAGDIDVTLAFLHNLSLDQMVEIERRNPQVTVYYLPSFVLEFIEFNLDNEWLKDKRVRHALIHAINREEISDRLFHGKQPVAHTWLPPGHEGYHRSVKRYAHDPSRARQLLTEAGFMPGSDGILRDASGRRFELSLMTTAGHAIREQVQLVLKDQLRTVGIELKIDNRPAGVLFGVMSRRRQIPHMVMAAGGAGPTALPARLWHSSQIPTPENNFEGLNTSGWRNAENDRLIERIMTELDPVRRIQMLHRQQEIWAEDLPMIPLFYPLSTWTAKKTLKNVQPGPGAGILYALERWEWTE